MKLSDSTISSLTQISTYQIDSRKFLNLRFYLMKPGHYDLDEVFGRLLSIYISQTNGFRAGANGLYSPVWRYMYSFIMFKAKHLKFVPNLKSFGKFLCISSRMLNRIVGVWYNTCHVVKSKPTKIDIFFLFHIHVPIHVNIQYHKPDHMVNITTLKTK